MDSPDEGSVADRRRGAELAGQVAQFRADYVRGKASLSAKEREWLLREAQRLVATVADDALWVPEE